MFHPQPISATAEMLFQVSNSQCCCLYVLVCSLAFCLQWSRVNGEVLYLFLTGALQSVMRYLHTWLFQSTNICSHCHQTFGSEVHVYLGCTSDFPALFFILVVPFSILSDYPRTTDLMRCNTFLSPTENTVEYLTWGKSSLSAFWSENGNHAMMIQEAVVHLQHRK